MTVLWNGRGNGGMIRGGYTALMGGSRWGAVRPSRLSEPFYVRARTSHTLTISIVACPYAPYIRLAPPPSFDFGTAVQVHTRIWPV